METPQPVKPKRTLTPEQIEKLKIARQKAAAAKRANKELDKYEKNKKKIEREKKRDEVVAQIIQEKEEKKKETIVVEPVKEEPIRKALKPKIEKPPPPEPEPEEESEEEEEEKEAPPPPKQFIRKTKTIIKKEPTEDELYSQASIQMLKQRFYEQTRRRLASELFNY